MNGAPILEITQESNGLAVDSSELGTDRVSIEQSLWDTVSQCSTNCGNAYLSGMLADTIAGVDDWYRRELSGQLRAANVRMPDYNSVRVAAQSADRIRETLALQNRGPLRVHAHDLASTALHGGIE